MPGPTRRDVLTGSAAALAAAPAIATTHQAATDRIAADLDRYIGFGGKASGGPGDTACGAWLDSELNAAGYATERQAIDVPWFDAQRAELVVGNVRASVIPQAIVVPTGVEGVSGPLVRIDPATGVASPLSGAIALIDLPFARWSSALAKPVRDTVNAALLAGAGGIAIVTNGPTGEAIALNAPGNKPVFAGPIAVMAPKAAKPFLAAAVRREPATLHIQGAGGRRPAFNLIGRLDRGKAEWVVVSTPRSGWFTCAGERGPGIAVWLALARWATVNVRTHNLLFICNSGHEYEYLGAERFLHGTAPPPERTAFWLHLGANVAARDWHEPGGGAMLPLPSADPQRFLVVSPPLVAKVRTAFAGLPGLEVPYPAGAGAAGELSNVLAAGYAPVAGIFGGHRFHHTQSDDARCVSAALVAPVVASCQRLLTGV